MKDRKIPGRGFQDIEHFFLSTDGKGDGGPGSNDTVVEKQVETDCSESLEKSGTQHRKTSETLDLTIAKLEVLKQACLGAAQRIDEKIDSRVWYQGAAAIVQEAISTLSETRNPSDSSGS